MLTIKPIKAKCFKTDLVFSKDPLQEFLCEICTDYSKCVTQHVMKNIKIG